MKFGVCSVAFGQLGYQQLARKISMYGFDATHLELKDILDIDHRLGKLSTGVANLVAEEFERHGVRIPILGCYSNLIHPDPVKRRYLINQFKEHLRFTWDFGASAVSAETGTANRQSHWDMMSIPCISLITAAGFLAEVGDLSGYDPANKLCVTPVSACGKTAPGFTKGKRPSANDRAALTMVVKNPEFRALHLYFTTRRDNSLKKKQSMIAICNKLIRVLLELGRKQKNYDTSKVLGPVREAQLQAAA